MNLTHVSIKGQNSLLGCVCVCGRSQGEMFTMASVPLVTSSSSVQSLLRAKVCRCVGSVALFASQIAIQCNKRKYGHFRFRRVTNSYSFGGRKGGVIFAECNTLQRRWLLGYTHNVMSELSEMGFFFGSGTQFQTLLRGGFALATGPTSAGHLRTLWLRALLLATKTHQRCPV